MSDELAPQLGGQAHELSGMEPELSGARRPVPRIVERHHRAFTHQVTDPLIRAVYFDCPDCGTRLAMVQRSVQVEYDFLFRDLINGGSSYFLSNYDIEHRLFTFLRDIAQSSECPAWRADS